jgi:hypothetical protein
MKTIRPLALALMLTLLLTPLAVQADNHEEQIEPLTWLSYIQTQPGKSQDGARHLASSGAEIYDALMAEGHILTWGVGMPVNHRPGDDFNLIEWVTFRDWAGVDAFMQAFMKMQMSKSDDDRMAEQEEWKAIMEPGSHYDEILRHSVVERGDGPPPAYFNLSYFPVNRGQGGTVSRLWKENVHSTLKSLQDAGTIGAFGVAWPEVHDGTGPNNVLFWTAMPNLAAQDAVDDAMEAAAEERGEEAQKAMMESFMEAIDFDGHHDRLLMVVHNGGSGGGEGEGGE